MSDKATPCFYRSATIETVQQWVYNITGAHIPDWVAAELIEARRLDLLEWAQDMVFVNWGGGKFWKITPSGLNDPYHIITKEETT